MSATGGRPTRHQVIVGGKPERGLFVRESKDGPRYEVCVRIGSKVVRRNLDAANDRDAVRQGRAKLAELESGKRIVGRGDLSLADLLAEWEAWAPSHYSPRCLTLYPERIRRHVLPILGETTKAASVRTSDLRRLITKLETKGLAGATVCGVLVATSAVLRFGVRHDYLDANPVRGLERGDRPSAKRRKEPRYLDRQQIDVLLAKLGSEFRPVAATLAFAALRVSEALALTWADVDFEAQLLHVPGTKTKASAQPVPLVADLAAELRAHQRWLRDEIKKEHRSFRCLHPDALVFSTFNDRPHHRKNVLRAIYRVGNESGLNKGQAKKVGCHDLRHSCAGLLLAAGVPAPKVSAILRHADVRTTLTFYAGLVESERGSLREVLEAALS